MGVAGGVGKSDSTPSDLCPQPDPDPKSPQVMLTLTPICTQPEFFPSSFSYKHIFLSSTGSWWKTKKIIFSQFLVTWDTHDQWAMVSKFPFHHQWFRSLPTSLPCPSTPDLSPIFLFATLKSKRKFISILSFSNFQERNASHASHGATISFYTFYFLLEYREQ